MGGQLHRLLDLQSVVVYAVVGLVVFAEDALFFGFVLPGETAAVIGGVAASLGRVSLIGMCVVVVIAAVVGDTVGYEIGSRYGSRLMRLGIIRRRQERVDAAQATLARRGGPAVFLGRFVAFLRAIMPFLAGTAHMPYRRFLAYNAAGGITWGIAVVLLGYLAGNSYSAIAGAFGKVAAGVVAVVGIVAVVVWRVRRRRRGGQPGD